MAVLTIPAAKIIRISFLLAGIEEKTTLFDGVRRRFFSGIIAWNRFILNPFKLPFWIIFTFVGSTSRNIGDPGKI